MFGTRLADFHLWSTARWHCRDTIWSTLPAFLRIEDQCWKAFLRFCQSRKIREPICLLRTDLSRDYPRKYQSNHRRITLLEKVVWEHTTRGYHQNNSPPCHGCLPLAGASKSGWYDRDCQKPSMPLTPLKNYTYIKANFDQVLWPVSHEWKCGERSEVIKDIRKSSSLTILARLYQSCLSRSAEEGNQSSTSELLNKQRIKAA